MVKRVGDGSERQKQAKQSQKKKTKQMLSICKVNSQFKKIRIHKGIPNDTLKIRSKMQKCATTNI